MAPVALAAWMLDHDDLSLEDITHAVQGEPVGALTLDQVLDHVDRFVHGMLTGPPFAP